MAATPSVAPQGNYKNLDWQFDLNARTCQIGDNKKTFVVLDMQQDPACQPLTIQPLPKRPLVYSAKKIGTCVMMGVLFTVVGGLILGRVGQLSQLPKNLHYLGLVGIVIASLLFAYSVYMRLHNTPTWQRKEQERLTAREQKRAEMDATWKRQVDQRNFIKNNLNEKFAQDKLSLERHHTVVLASEEILWEELKPGCPITIGTHTKSDPVNGDIVTDRVYYRSPSGRTVFGPLNPSELNTVQKTLLEPGDGPCPYMTGNQECPLIAHDPEHRENRMHGGHRWRFVLGNGTKFYL